MESLFKAKRVDGKGWVQGFPTYDLEDSKWRIVATIHYSGDGMENPPCDHQQSFIVIPETLCQFTGFIHDEKKVFQDDTFKVWLEDSADPEGGYWWKIEVKQHLGCWILAQVGHDYRSTPIEQCELLFITEYELILTGNIHD